MSSWSGRRAGEVAHPADGMVAVNEAIHDVRPSLPQHDDVRSVHPPLDHIFSMSMKASDVDAAFRAKEKIELLKLTSLN